jgi:GNAT superfamily N-acetyltransferase
MAAYECTYETDLDLRDGPRVHVRPITSADEAALTLFLARLSPRSLAFRFFSAGVRPAVAARRAVAMDGHDQVGLVAIADGEIVGHAMYARTSTGAVEIAFAVADELQGHGLGTLMLVEIAAAARENGFEELEAEVMPSNHRMLDVFAGSGFPMKVRAEPGVVHVQMTPSLVAPPEWLELKPPSLLPTLG